MQNKELFHAKEKTDFKVNYAGSWSSLWSISKIPCPSYLRDNYSEKPWRRTGPLKTVSFYILEYIHSFLR